jgi:hypothetical protein
MRACDDSEMQALWSRLHHTFGELGRSVGTLEASLPVRLRNELGIV